MAFLSVIFFVVAIILIVRSLKSNDAAGTTFQPTPDQRPFPVAGINYRKNVRPGTYRARVTREPENEYDPDALRIDTLSGVHVGYIKQSYQWHLLKDTNHRLPALGTVVITRVQEGSRSFFVGTLYLDLQPDSTPKT